MEIYDAIADYYAEKNVCTLGEAAKIIGTDVVILGNVLVKYGVINQIFNGSDCGVAVGNAFKDLFVVVEIKENGNSIKLFLFVKKLYITYLKSLVEADALLTNVDDIPF